MKKSLLLAVPLALLLSGGVTMAMTAATQSRIQAMDNIGRNYKQLALMLKGATPYDGATAASAATSIAASLDKFKNYFPKSSMGDPKSSAAPEIWSDPAGFEQARAAARAAAAALAASDQNSFNKATMTLVQACRSCHQRYRSG